MAFTMKILSRSYVPGSQGYNTSGTPKQAKVRVIGEVDITSYTAGGEVIPKSRFGVSSFDSVHFNTKEFVSTAALFRLYAFDHTNDKLIVYAVDAAAGAGDEIAVGSGDLGIIAFEVVGDAALPTESTISDSINTGLPV